MTRNLLPTLLIAGALASAGTMRAVMLPTDKRSLVLLPPDEPGFYDDETFSSSTDLLPDPYLVKSAPPPKPLPVPKAPPKPQPTPRPPPTPIGATPTPKATPSPTPKTRPT